MTIPAHRSVSYLPGRWCALVTDELTLLADVHLADPLLAACWKAGGSGGADAVLEVLARHGQQGPPSFVLVAGAGDGIRLVVAGRARAEVFAGRADPTVHGAGEGGARVEQRLDTGSDVRLVADDPTPFERISPLPLTSGIVLASYVFTTASAPPPPPAAPQGDAVGWIPSPLAQPSREFPVATPASGEPSAQVSGVFRALPWRPSLLDPDTDDPDTSQDEPPAPPGAAAAPVLPDEAPRDVVPEVPLVLAVYCPHGHPNPPHVDACRLCGFDVAPQQPATVERPLLGVLRLSTGEVIPLDRDALLGRAPFAVDRRTVRLVEVASPNNDISRSHLRITLDGWQVFATDLGSTNGTAVTLPGRPAALLRPHDPFALAPGSVLSLADEAQARFDLT